MATAILSMAILPILSMGTRSVTTTRAEELRVAASLTVDALLERLACSSAAMDLYPLLTPNAAKLDLWKGTDILPAILARPELAMEFAPFFVWNPVFKEYCVRVDLTLTRRVTRSADLLECRVWWRPEGPGGDLLEMFRRSRLVVDGGP